MVNQHEWSIPQPAEERHAAAAGMAARHEEGNPFRPERGIDVVARLFPVDTRPARLGGMAIEQDQISQGGEQ